MREIEAAEKVRQEQQGYGHPIISWEFKGTRMVAVKSTVWWPPVGKSWIYFPDFLFDYLKKTLGHEWGAKAQREGVPHPLFRWLGKIGQYQKAVPGDKGRPIVGYVACVLHLAYALYQIAHNDMIPSRFLARVRNPLTFVPAFYEIIVGAALAVAGMEIENAEKKATDQPTPEFRAKSKHTGTTYDVEAKWKAGWQTKTDNFRSDEFKRELRSYIRDQIYKTSKKRLTNAILWIELSIPTLTNEDGWRMIIDHATGVIEEAISMTIDGESIAPMFVVLTNHTFLANEDVEGEPSFGSLHTIGISDFPLGRTADLEDLLEAYDKYRDVFAMMEGWRIARAIPPHIRRYAGRICGGRRHYDPTNKNRTADNRP